MEKLETFKLSLQQLVSNECAKAPGSSFEWTEKAMLERAKGTDKAILDRVKGVTMKTLIAAKTPLATGDLILEKFKFEKEGLGFTFDWRFAEEKVWGTNEGSGFVFLEGGGGGPRRIRTAGATFEECMEKAVYDLSYAIMWEIAHN